jgi:hypothetical protein
MFKPFGRVIAAFILCTALANVTWAQGTRATISGVVQDPTGAAIPAVELSLRSLATSAVVKASSGADGFYTFPGLVAGGYDLTVAAKGFREYIQRGISVNLDQQVRIDVSLELGTTSEAIEVSANASPLNFDSAVKTRNDPAGISGETPADPRRSHTQRRRICQAVAGRDNGRRRRQAEL